MKYKITIGGEALDLSAGQVIAFTLQAVAFGQGDPTKRLVSFTNQFTVPITANNRDLLDYSNLIGANTSLPYTKTDAKLFVENILIRDVQLTVQRVTPTGFEVVLYDKPKDLSTILGNKVLSDLDFGDSPATWDKTYWDNRRNATDYICAPVFNYGQIDGDGAVTSIGDYYLPSASYKDVLTQIFTEAGFTLSGDFYDNDEIFNNLVITYGRKNWPGTSFKINEILSETIKQIDLVRDFCDLFNNYLRFDGDEVQIVTEAELFGATPIDWTGKRADKKVDLEFNWEGWSRQNNFRYNMREQESGTIGSVPSDIFDGSLDVDNENIGGSRDVYTSLFDPMTPAAQKLGGAHFAQFGLIRFDISAVSYIFFCSGFPIWKDEVPTGYVFDKEPRSTLAILRDPEPSVVGSQDYEGAITYDATPRTDYKIAYFAFPNAAVIAYDKILAWKSDPSANGISSTGTGLLERYYPQLASILERPKKVIRKYNLSLEDIRNLDLLTPVFDTDQVYLISKIRDFVPGHVTEVELLKASAYIAP